MNKCKKQAVYWTQNKILLIAFIARICLILYAHVHDYVFQVNFTDIDYVVFTDAAKHVANNESPYNRATYRYTPFLAMLLVFNNNWIDFGKLLFCVFDIIVAWLCIEISKAQQKSTKFDNLRRIVLFWLANPLTAIISARGNADSLVCFAVLLVLLWLLQQKFYHAALAHGLLAIHLKIYPIIYLPSIYLFILTEGGRKSLASFSNRTSLFTYFQEWVSTKGVLYIFVCLSSFGLIIGVFWNVYGDQFLEEFLIYHLKRRDIRHNFSPYFYLLYLVDSNSYWSKIIGSMAFIPQAVCILLFAFRHYDDLPFCWFLTTFSFVAFNKVSTSQYFIWYIVFLPLITDRLKMTAMRSIGLIALWFSSQGIWLFFAYLFEFQGYNTFALIWISSLLFLLVNCVILRDISAHYSFDASISEKNKVA